MIKLDNIFYMYSNMDNSSQILLFLIALVGLMLLSICIINFITRKKDEKYDRRFNQINRYTKVMEREKPVKKQKVREIKKEKPTLKEEYVKPVKEVKQPIEEEIEVMDEEVVEIISDDNSIDKISMLLEDNVKKPKPINLTEFEKEEEKNAIISYDELVKKAGAKKIVYKTQKETINEVKKEEKIEIKQEENKGKFRASQVISPIYGVQKKEDKKEELEDFIDLENIPVKKRELTDEDLQKDITFLTNLKTFRSNLD